MILSSGNLKTALSSLRATKWRSMLTMLGVIIGVSSVITIVSFGEGLKHQVSGQISQLGSSVISVRPGKLVNRAGNGEIKGINIPAFLSTSTLTQKDVDSLRTVPSVDGVVPISFVTSSAKTIDAHADNLFVVGTSPDMAKILNLKVKYGAFFTEDNPDAKFAVIGSNVALKLFGELNPVGSSLQLEGNEFIVRGVLDSTNGGVLSTVQIDFNSAVFIPSQAANVLTEEHTNILQILARSKNHDLDATVNEIHQTILKTHQGQEDFSVLTQKELQNIADNTLNTITRFISAIAAISLLVGGISIMDIMWVSISERTREIGIRKAVGATNRQIMNQFLIEGSALSITGGVIGIIVSFIINGLLKLYTDFDPVITPLIMVLAVGISVSMGILFSVAPALKAARKHPIEALRG